MVSAVKTTLGMLAFSTNFMFINRLCLIFEPSQCPAELDMSMPNALVAFSLLVALGNCHFMQIIFRNHAMPSWVANILDAFVTMYLTELIIRQFWIPLLDLSYCVCNQCAIYLHEFSKGGMVNTINPITVWLKTDAMHSIQMTIALGFVYIMLNVTGFVEFVKRLYFNWFGRAPGDDDLRWRNEEKYLGLPENCPKMTSILKNREPMQYSCNYKLKRKPSLRSVTFKT